MILKFKFKHNKTLKTNSGGTSYHSIICSMHQQANYAEQFRLFSAAMLCTFLFKWHRDTSRLLINVFSYYY